MNRLIFTASTFVLVCLFGSLAFGGLLAVDHDSGILYSVSTVNASLTPVGSTGVADFAEIEFAPNGTLYGFTDSGAPTPSLYKINPSTAAVSLIGPLNLPFVFEGGLAFASNGSAIGTNGDSSGNPELFSLNLATGAATVIATISGGDHDINGLAYRSDGELIGLDRVSNSLLVIDPTTGVSSVLAAVPTTVGAIGGMTVLGGVGYYNTSGPQGSISGSNELYSFNLLTGASTLVGSFAPTISDSGISGLAGQVPEPSSVILAACGLVGVAAWGWRRRALAL
jgi:PEP-CTERM motif